MLKMKNLMAHLRYGSDPEILRRLNFINNVNGEGQTVYGLVRLIEKYEDRPDFRKSTIEVVRSITTELEVIKSKRLGYYSISSSVIFEPGEKYPDIEFSIDLPLDRFKDMGKEKLKVRGPISIESVFLDIENTQDFEYFLGLTDRYGLNEKLDIQSGEIDNVWGGHRHRSFKSN